MENQYPIASSPTDLELLPLLSFRPLNFYQYIEIVYENSIKIPIPLRVYGTISRACSLLLRLPFTSNFVQLPSKFNSVSPIQTRVSQLEGGAN